MAKKEVTILKMDTISILAALICWFLFMLLFALIFTVSHNLFLYFFFLVLGFVSGYAIFKYFTGTFEIIFNDEEKTAIIRWEKKVVLSHIKEQTIDLTSLSSYKTWS